MVNAAESPGRLRGKLLSEPPWSLVATTVRDSSDTPAAPESPQSRLWRGVLPESPQTLRGPPTLLGASGPPGDSQDTPIAAHRGHTPAGFPKKRIH